MVGAFYIQTHYKRTAGQHAEPGSVALQELDKAGKMYIPSAGQPLKHVVSICKCYVTTAARALNEIYAVQTIYLVGNLQNKTGFQFQLRIQ
jgi:hypothetical protein